MLSPRTPPVSSAAALPATATPLPDSPAPPCPLPDRNGDNTLLGAIQSNLLGPVADHFSDITLLSRDGVGIPAVRALLAVRSPYFNAIFFSTYSDRTRETADLSPISSVALQDVVRFAYTDKSHLVDKATDAMGKHVARCLTASTVKRSKDDFRCPISPDNVASLIELISAADYVDMPGLVTIAARAAEGLVTSFPRIACLVLEAVRRYPAVDVVAPSIVQAVKEVMRRDPVSVFLVSDFRTEIRTAKRRRTAMGSDGEQKSDTDLVMRPISNDAGVVMLSASTLEEALQDREIFACEGYLFQVLYHWATDGSPLSLLKGAVRSEVREMAFGDRWEPAKKLSRCVDLGRLQPTFLAEYVEPSGLVHPDDIFVAFRELALQAEGHDMLYNKFRRVCKWPSGLMTLKASRTSQSYALETPWLRSGVHEWTFRLNRWTTNLFIGVSSVKPGDVPFFAMAKTGWAYGVEGFCAHDGTTSHPDGPMAIMGKKVKLILNLLRSGTMSIVVEGMPKSFLAFKEMKKTASQFIPVVYLEHPASVTLIDERHNVAKGDT